MESIRHQLQDQARRVEFICGIDLLALFQEYWPDFLRFESAVLTRYLSSLSAGLSVDSALIALLTRNNANLGLKPFEKFYVPNQLEIRLDRLRAPGVLLPWAKALTQYITSTELEDFVSRLRFWKQALRSPELTGEGSPLLRDLTVHIEEFCRGARKYWDQALKTGRARILDSKRMENHHGREKGGPEGPTAKENPSSGKRERTREGPEERKLPTPANILQSFGRFLGIVQRVNEQLNKIDEASVAVRNTAENLTEATSALLANPEFYFTSIGYDYLNATPGMIKQESRRRLGHLPHHPRRVWTRLSLWL